MIISHSRRYIFVHIPKTGGTSLALALESKAMKDDILIGDTPKAKRRRKRVKALQTSARLWKHSTLSDIVDLMPKTGFQGYFVFTLVRNPWDRMVSYYTWARAQTFDHPAIALARAVDFSSFLSDTQTQAAVARNGYETYVRDATGRERCDLYMKIEELPDGIALIEERLGLRLPVPPKINTSERARDWRGYYSDADAARVASLCKADIARFGYRFDP